MQPGELAPTERPRMDLSITSQQNPTGELLKRKVTRTSPCNQCCSTITVLVTSFLVPTAISTCANGVCLMHPATQYVILPGLLATIAFVAKQTINWCRR